MTILTNAIGQKQYYITSGATWPTMILFSSLGTLALGFNHHIVKQYRQILKGLHISKVVAL